MSQAPHPVCRQFHSSNLSNRLRSRFAARPCSILAIAAAAALLPQVSSAVIWDVTSGDGSTITTGNGIWDLTLENTNWNNGSTDVAWTNGNAAVFSGTDATSPNTYEITLGSDLSADTLTFNNSGYVLTAATPTTLTLITPSNAIRVASGKSATIGTNVTITQAAAMQITGGGTLNITGTVKTTLNNLLIQNGTTVNVQAGGSLNAGASLVVGSLNSPGSNGTLLVSGGTVTTTNVSNNGNLVIGNAGGTNATYVLTITAGSVLVDPQSADGIRFGPSGALTEGTINGTFNLDGGVVETRKIGETPVSGQPITSTFNFNGGLLRANNTPKSGNFMAGLDAAYVKQGGAKIDSNGFDITIAQALLHDAALDAQADGGLTKSGTGTLTLSAANTYTGATIINAGALQVSNASGLGDISAGTSVAAGAALRLSGSVLIGAEALTLNGTGVANDGALRNVSNNNTYGGTITLGSSSLITSDSGTLTLDVASGNAITGANYNLTFGGAGNVTVADAIATGSGSVTKEGAGTLTLNAANTYTGATIIRSGRISTSNLGNGGQASALGASSSASSNLVFDGGTLRYTGGGNFTSDRGFTLGNGGGTIEVAHTVSNMGLRFAGVVTGSGDLTVTRGSSSTGLFFAMSAVNTYTGKTFVTNGVSLNLRRAEALGATGSFANGTVITGATVRLDPGGTEGSNVDSNFTEYFTLGEGGALNNATRSNTVSGNILLTGNASFTTSSTGGSMTITGPVELGSNQLTVSPVDVGPVSIQGGISGGSGSLNKSGPGLLTVSGNANTYTGSTIVTAGTLNVNGTLSATSALSISGGTLQLGAADRINDSASVTMSGGTLDTAGFAENLGSFTLAGTAAIDLGNGASVLRFLDSSGNAPSWTGTLSISNWSGTLTGGGTDQLFFGSNASGLTSEQLAMIQFINPAGFDPGTYGAQILSTGEIVAIPEPGSAVTLLCALGMFGSLGRIRRRPQR